MILKVFTVYDSKAEAYLPPFFFKATGEAIRAFTDTVNDGKSPISQHYSDYTLFEIGVFDDAAGTITCSKAAINLGNGIEYIRDAVTDMFPAAVTSKERK